MNIQRALEPCIVERNHPKKDQYDRYQDDFKEERQSVIAIYELTGGIMVNMSLLVSDTTHQGLTPDKDIQRGMRISTYKGMYYVDNADPKGRLNQLALKRIEGLNER